MKIGLKYVRRTSRASESMSRTLTSKKLGFGTENPDLTYVTVHLTYVNHHGNPAHVHQLTKTRILQKQCLTYVSMKLTYVRGHICALFSL